MYGIRNANGSVLCRTLTDPKTYVFKTWDRAKNLVVIESAMEIDSLLQEMMVASDNYNLTVFEYTSEQEEEMVVRKLRGY
jgi:hypothetical protein